MRYAVTRSDGLYIHTPSRASAIDFARHAETWGVPFEWVETPARFVLKFARWRTDNPWKLKDRERPAFVGHYATSEAACRAMDNIIRREAGAPERMQWSDAMLRSHALAAWPTGECSICAAIAANA